jgi:uncharacterized protein YqjF (DUF2071 family)
VPFLTARWESLVLLNYPCPPRLLEPLVPADTALDTWQGKTLVSLVGFLFADTRLRGLAVPCHRTFEEVNLRFYVTRTQPGGAVKRAVVFVRELVPRAAIAAIARWTYNEPYHAVPMSHAIDLHPDTGGRVEYRWTHDGRRFAIRASVTGPAREMERGSEAEFITEHYWGYNRQRDGSTLEYEVQHPPWLVWTAADATFTGDAISLYGPDFAGILREPPRSAFVSAGSAVAVTPGVRIG